MMVWSMPADEFGSYMVIGVFIIFFAYESLIEINTNRIKRFNKK